MKLVTSSEDYQSPIEKATADSLNVDPLLVDITNVHISIGASLLRELMAAAEQEGADEAFEAFIKEEGLKPCPECGIMSERGHLARGRL